ncbi:hypothetical protein ATN84_01710 [Paramesorhizobium deserti]|uniref:Lipoprotein n=1 Tax=Paramesorhizobium deserti TaxID=1494590 RepID=A0A135HZ93_9HYPH|nr:hypothetical protein [Paramesorhizobium deserti]KXF78534.1 hypothetical protein ATN84_01710 [Paramesorhizobium deserti]
MSIKISAILAPVALTGCMSANVNMYPIEGPYAQIVPRPVVKAVAQGVEGNSGPIKATLPDGQTCIGTWSSVAPRTGYVSTGALFTQYGAVFGSTVTQGILPGVNKGQAFMTCSRGTSVDAEFFTGSGTANGYGIAKDSTGNVYKMLF